jgi:hypothetical protein
MKNPQKIKKGDYIRVILQVTELMDYDPEDLIIARNKDGEEIVMPIQEVEKLTTGDLLLLKLEDKF